MSNTINRTFVYVLDYESCNLYELIIKDEDVDKIAEILSEHGLRDTNCNYMFSNKKLDLTNLK